MMHGLADPKVHYRVHSSSLLFRILSQIQATSSRHISLGSSLILPSHLRLDLPSCLLTSSYEQHLLFSTVHATFPAHVILLKISGVVCEI